MQSHKADIEQTVFPVKEVPAITGYSTDSTGHKFIVREDTNEVISCMTDTYKLITNEQVIDKAMPILKKRGAVLKEAEVFGGGARTSWNFTLQETEVEIEPGDAVNPSIIIKNSYDGSCEASAIAGAYRLVCSNGMVIGYTLGRNSIRHTIWNKNVDFEEMIQEVVKSVETVVDTDFTRLLRTKVKEKHISQLLTMFPEQIIAVATMRMILKKPSNYWQLYNVATWIATHKMKRDKEATHKLEQSLYPSILRMTEEAEIARA